MDIKEKFKTFLDKQRIQLKSPEYVGQSLSSHVSQDDFQGRTAIIPYHQQREVLIDEHKLTPEAEKAVIDSVEALYFEVDGEDVANHELQKYPDILDLHVLNGVRTRLRKQQAVIKRCVSNLILEKQTLCHKQLGHIAKIQNDLCLAINLCNSSRSNLQLGRSQFSSSSLGVLLNYQKRKNVAQVMKSLQMIRTLQMTDVELQGLLKTEDYPGAINLLLEGQKAASTFKHFTCISELSSKLQDTIELVEVQLDSAVSKIASNFNESLYGKLVLAFDLLNKTQMMMDQLHMHLTSHIHNTAFNIILGYVELYNGAVDNISPTENMPSSPSFSKLSYSELCKYINAESFLSCLLDLSKGMWVILKNYKKIMKWHDSEQLNLKNGEIVEDSEIERKRKYIKQKLDHGLVRLWQDVQAKVRTFILASDLSLFKFDDFLKILNVINKLIEVGECFCGSPSETLQDSIKKQCFNFFQSYHSTKMEELHMILENEGWEICPVKDKFHINQLNEFKFLKSDFSSRGQTPISSPRKGLPNGNRKKDLFDSFIDGSPFDSTSEDSFEEDIMITIGARGDPEAAMSEDDSEDELADELRRDFVDEHGGEAPHCPRKKKEMLKMPMITNSTLSIFRLIGKYLQMMKLLRAIAFDVFVCLSQLFEYYMYSIFVLFSTRSPSDFTVSPQLRATLQRIEHKLILNSDNFEDTENRQKVPPPAFGPHILSDTLETLFGFAVRVIAVESLTYLGHQFESLQINIESLMPSGNNTFLQQFYTNTVMLTSEVRVHVYMHVASKVVDYDGLFSKMSDVKWDIAEFQDHHSSYVDNLLRELQFLNGRLSDLRRGYPIPEEAVEVLWANVIKCVHRTMLEGFSSARKCSNEGRSLMQLDFQQFLMKVEGLTSIRPLPDRHLVDGYIKAYYLPDGEIEEWVVSKRGIYSNKSLISLTNVMTQVSKKTRQRISVLLDDVR